MIAVVDYGVNNVRAWCARSSRAATPPSSPPIPGGPAGRPGAAAGRGQLRAGHRNLARTGLGDAVRDVAAAGRPVMGICLGLQLSSSGATKRPTRGAGPAARPGAPPRRGLPVPHVGWAEVGPTPAGPRAPDAAAAMNGGEFFYHVHSYHPAELPDDAVLATADYGSFPDHRGAGERRRRAVPPGEVAARRDRAALRVRAVGALTTVSVSLVDVYVLRGAGPRWNVSCFAAAPGGRCPGSWETVHGHIEPGETPGRGGAAGAAGGNRARAAPPLQSEPGRALLSAPPRRGGAGAGLRGIRGRPAAVRISAEHDRYEWLAPGAARGRFAWPRERRTLDDLVALIGGGRRGAGGGRAAGMLARRIIPCLDVAGGRVVKGIHFESLRDAGDPVEQAARYDADGADELVFLDISATTDARRTTLDMVSRVADTVFIPFTVGGGIRTVDDAGRRSAPGPTRSRSTPRRCATPRWSSGSRRASARSASWWRWT